MKKLLSFALVCVMLLALVPQALAAKQELVVSVSSGIESKEWFQEGMKRFNEKHPNVEVVLEPHEGISARPKIVSQIYTGNAPDVLYANLYWVKDFAKNGWITPVNDYFDEETINDFYEDFRNYATVDGKLYGFFNATDIATIVYRKSLLEAAGIEIPAEGECWTWEQFVEAGKKLTQDTDNDGKIDVWGIGVSAANEGTTTYTNFPMYFMAGGTLVDENGNSTCGGEAAVKTMQFYYDLLNTYKTTPPESYAYSHSELVSAFNAGQYAMLFDASWSIGSLAPQFPEDVYAMLYPVPQAGDASQGLCGGWVYTIMAEEDETKQLAADFIREMIAVDLCVARYNENMALPVRYSAFDRIISEENDPVRKSWMTVFSKQMEHTNLKPGDAIYDIIQDEYTVHLAQVMKGEMTAQDAVTDMENKIQQRGKEAGFIK